MLGILCREKEPLSHSHLILTVIMFTFALGIIFGEAKGPGEKPFKLSVWTCIFSSVLTLLLGLPITTAQYPHIRSYHVFSQLSLLFFLLLIHGLLFLTSVRPRILLIFSCLSLIIVLLSCLSLFTLWLSCFITLFN